VKKSIVLEAPTAPVPVADPVAATVEKLKAMSENVGKLRGEIETLQAELNQDLEQHAAQSADAVLSGAPIPPEPKKTVERRATLEGLRRTLAVVEARYNAAADAARRQAHAQLGARFGNFCESRDSYKEFLESRIISLLLLAGEIFGDVNILDALSGKSPIGAKLDAAFRNVREFQGRGLVSGMEGDTRVAGQALVQLSGAPVSEVTERVEALARLMEPWAEVQKSAEAKLEKLR
jgi:hypothetical protein